VPWLRETSGRSECFFDVIKVPGFEYLVGDSSRLIWTPYRGRFDVTLHAVPSWDKDVDSDNVSVTRYIARFFHLGDLYVTEVTEGANGM
jgi:hypothetical protein